MGLIKTYKTVILKHLFKNIRINKKHKDPFLGVTFLNIHLKV